MSELIQRLLEAKMAADRLPDSDSRDEARRLWLQAQLTKLLQNVEQWEKTANPVQTVGAAR